MDANELEDFPPGPLVDVGDEVIVDAVDNGVFQLQHVVFFKPSLVVGVAEVEEVLLDSLVSTQNLIQD